MKTKRASERTQHKRLERSRPIGMEIATVGLNIAVGIKVATNQGSGQHPLKMAQLFKAVVKLMVAQTGGIVTHRIHQPDDKLAFGGSTDGSSKREVACRHHRHMAAHTLQAVAQARQHGVAVDSTMYIILVQNYHIARTLCV